MGRGMMDPYDLVNGLTRIGAMRHAAVNMAALAHSWKRCAFPILQLSHTLAASLVATTIAPGIVDEMAMPWDSFAVSSPPGAISQCEVFVLCCKLNSDGKQRWVVFAGEDYAQRQLFRTCDSLSDLSSLVNAPAVKQLDGTLDDESDTASRLSLTALRLIAGAALEASASNVGARSSSYSASVKMKRGEPRCQIFEIRRPVILDVRSEVREWFVNGSARKQGPLSIQTLVRGHYKMQPHGEGRAQRKYIHVEPYWRGPEDAPIVVRPHRLVESGQ